MNDFCNIGQRSTRSREAKGSLARDPEAAGDPEDRDLDQEDGGHGRPRQGRAGRHRCPAGCQVHQKATPGKHLLSASYHAQCSTDSEWKMDRFVLG